MTTQSSDRPQDIEFSPASHFARALWAGAFLLGAVLIAAAADFPLIQDGKPVATIVLPAQTEWGRYVNATPEEIAAFARQRFPKASNEQLAEVLKKLPDLRQKKAKSVGDDEVLAATELVEFVKKMSGAELTVARPKAGEPQPKGPRVLLGAELARVEGLGAELDALGPHGFLIRVRPDRVIVAGRTGRGTLHGAYSLLESFGCRWVMPGPFGEVVPKKETLTVKGDRTENPSHAIQRHWWASMGPGKEFARWLLRNKGGEGGLFDSKINQSHASRLPMEWGAKTELGTNVTVMVRDYKRDDKKQILRNKDGSPSQPILVEKQERRLPDEYYALIAGKVSTWFANMVNPKAWDLHAKYFRQAFYQAPMENYLSISAEDGLILDDRPEVRLLDSNEYDWTQGAPVVTDRMWFFHRRYMDKVREEHPNRKFGILVYANNLPPPRIETVHPAMALVLAPLNICPLHDLRNEKCKTNRAYRGWLTSWMEQVRAAGAETYYYDYFPIGHQWSNFILSPQWQIIGRNYPWLHELGLTGHTTQGFDDWGSQGLTHWVAVRLYWDATQDYNALVAEYCRLRFGESAGAAMHAYYRVFEKRMDEIPDTCGNEIWGNHLAINAETRARARKALAEAEPLVKGEREKQHFQAVALFQQAMDAWCDGIEHTRETGDFAAGAKIMETAFKIRDQLNVHYSHFVNPRQTDPDPTKVHNLRRYRSNGWYNKYLLWGETLAKSGASLVLPREMSVALDTANVAWARGWHKPEVSVDKLERWDTTVPTDIKYQTQQEPAAFFYRTSVDVPASFANRKKVVLFFPSLIGRAVRVWVNGEPVAFDHGEYKDETWRGPATFWSDYNHTREFDVTGLVKPGAKNTLAFRVFKSFDHGGTYDRVFLLADPPVIETSTKEP
jgi:hypothetical protein